MFFALGELAELARICVLGSAGGWCLLLCKRADRTPMNAWWRSSAARPHVAVLN
jgi:hypothetical protein